jgi:hypothetical protein
MSSPCNKTALLSKSKSKSHCDWRSVSQYVLVSSLSVNSVRWFDSVAISHTSSSSIHEFTVQVLCTNWVCVRLVRCRLRFLVVRTSLYARVGRCRLNRVRELDCVVSNPQEGLLRVNKFCRTIAGVPVPTYQKFWADKRTSLTKEYQIGAKTHPDSVPCMQHLFKVLCDLEALAGSTPKSVGESEEWAAVIGAAGDNLVRYSVALQGKPLYTALYGSYTVTLNELKSLLKSSTQARQTSQGDCFQEVRSRKRHSTAEAARSPKKAAVPTPAGQVPTKNFFRPPPDSPNGHLCPRRTTQCRRGGSTKEICPAAPNSTDVCSQPNPAAEETERRGPTKLRASQHQERDQGSH